MRCMYEQIYYRYNIEHSSTWIDEVQQRFCKQAQAKEKVYCSFSRTGVKVIQHKDITDNWKKSLRVRPTSKEETPCSHQTFWKSPSHKYGYLKALEDKDGTSMGNQNLWHYSLCLAR